MIKSCRITGTSLAAIACLVMACPRPVLAEPLEMPNVMRGVRKTGVVTDVALRDGGVLVGQVFSSVGVPRANARVLVRDLEGRDRQVLADEQGTFTIDGLKGGIYQINAGATVATYRLWAPGTAPPAARSGALLVEQQEVLRGNGPVTPRILQHPWAFTAFVAAAITVPIAVNNGRNGS